MKKNLFILVVILAILAAAVILFSSGANTPRGVVPGNGTVNETPQAIAPGEPNPHGSGNLGIIPPAVESSARAAFVAKTRIPEKEISNVFKERVDWPDSCLGLAGADQLCADVIVPGWKVTITARGKDYEVRTDAAGKLAIVK